jgi:hypothetical protein
VKEKKDTKLVFAGVVAVDLAYMQKQRLIC